VDPRRFVFLDECGTHLAHTRAYGRAPRGARAVGAVPRNRGRVTTLIASLTAAGVGPATTRQGGTTKGVFVAYVQEEVAPALEAGQVVVLDNLGAHRAAAVREAVEARGARLLHLPSYSPDLNPIELAFGALKAALRKAGARTREALDEAIRQALAAITPEQVRGFFAHCGYPLPDQP
jgi:transposase